MEIEKMNDFISTIRTDRLRQIEQYREKGYLIDKKFRLVDKIEVIHECKFRSNGAPIPK